LKGCPAVNQSESPAACGSGRKGIGKEKRQPGDQSGGREGKKTRREQGRESVGKGTSQPGN